MSTNEREHAWRGMEFVPHGLLPDLDEPAPLGRRRDLSQLREEYPCRALRMEGHRGSQFERRGQRRDRDHNGGGGRYGCSIAPLNGEQTHRHFHSLLSVRA